MGFLMFANDFLALTYSCISIIIFFFFFISTCTDGQFILAAFSSLKKNSISRKTFELPLGRFGKEFGFMYETTRMFHVEFYNTRICVTNIVTSASPVYLFFRRFQLGLCSLAA